MNKLKNYLNDGANCQARAVMCFLQSYDGIEESWNEELGDYEANIGFARWENCREQGYVVYMRNKKSEQLNIAFFEHRNSDQICAVMWKQNSINALTIDTADFGNVYTDKYDVSYSVEYGEALKMADWIWNELAKHWIAGRKGEV